RCNRALGTQIRPDEMAEVFRRLGFDVEPARQESGPAEAPRDTEGQGSQGGGSAPEWTVVVPSRRMDIAMEADLVEEVARLAGYDQIPSTLPEGPAAPGLRNAHQRLRHRTRDVLTGAGMTEVFTYTFRRAEDLDALRVPADSPLRQVIPLLRPMSEERTALRTHLLPGLAEVARYNLAHEVAGGEIFEIGRVYWPKQLPLLEQPVERVQWAGLWFGSTEPAVGGRPRRYDFYDAKGAIEVWLEAIGLAGAEFLRGERPWLHPGRSAEVVAASHVLGSFGELHPETGEALDVAGAVYAEFDLDLIAELLQERWRVRRVPRHPSSRRDLAAVVRKEVAAADLIREAVDAVRSVNPDLSVECRVFDVYSGPGIPAGHRSVAISFVYRAPDRTLTDEEVAAAEQAVVARWENEFGAKLRAGI
ncbi:MAG: phenylalanine--tRNA ligase subunit beta, partial [Alicyclobacillus sp.]|nr:phenylalanine--tRNA ligase subunit beta [Alicyclobacillus sp.]